MSTLTSDQKAYLRAKSGDLECNGHEIVSDSLMQTYFDTANGDFPLTIVSMLEDRWFAAKASTITLVNGGTALSSANLKDLKDKLDYWLAATGTGPGSLRVGKLSLGIDTRYADTRLLPTLDTSDHDIG